MIYQLYLKTHNVTGLKYLGMTTRNDPYYHGGGYYWLRHLKKHGNDISSKIIFRSEDHELFKRACLFYSYLYNIVESEEWANLMLETGEVSGPKSKKTKLLQSRLMKKRYESGWVHPMLGVKRSDMAEYNQLYRKGAPSLIKGIIREKFECPNCHKTVGGKTNLIRWHGDRCREKELV